MINVAINIKKTTMMTKILFSFNDSVKVGLVGDAFKYLELV